MLMIQGFLKTPQFQQSGYLPVNNDGLPDELSAAHVIPQQLERKRDRFGL